jgi:ATP-dependent protease HslVU (ClpYQ) ATPase subunit
MKGDIFQMKTKINFKQLAMADLDINGNIEPLSKEIEQALSDFLKNRKKRKKVFVGEADAV